MAKLLPLKGEYFDAIRDGTNPEEFRLATPYWTRRLEGRSFTGIKLTKGYPKRGDGERRIEPEWRGYRRTTITHPHFGPDPVDVFAIDVSQSLSPPFHDRKRQMSEWQVELLLAKYGPWCMAYAMFWPVFRDFVQGFCRGLLGI